MIQLAARVQCSAEVLMHVRPECGVPSAVPACSAGRLQAKFVIHTVGPVYENAEASAPLLRKAYT